MEETVEVNSNSTKLDEVPCTCFITYFFRFKFEWCPDRKNSREKIDKYWTNAALALTVLSRKFQRLNAFAVQRKSSRDWNSIFSWGFLIAETNLDHKDPPTLEKNFLLVSKKSVAFLNFNLLNKRGNDFSPLFSPDKISPGESLTPKLGFSVPWAAFIQQKSKFRAMEKLAVKLCAANGKIYGKLVWMESSDGILPDDFPTRIYAFASFV